MAKEENLGRIGFVLPKDHQVECIVDGLKKARRGETIIVVDGECDGPEWYHPAVLRQTILAGRRGVRIKVVAGPILATEPVIGAKLLGDTEMLKKLKRWLIPLTQEGLMTAQWGEGEEGRHLKVTGFETTVHSFGSMILFKTQAPNVVDQIPG